MEEEKIICVLIISAIIGWFSTTGIKSQGVRLLDIFVYGPFLIYIGTILTNDILAIIMFVLGATSITYNLRNYINLL